ncbi:hypothetical protein RISK_005301 [Rhodopirellula islandica]|uniref:Uncharacterized protein n=1 Tax=Rhodopirellula islandica TaxID=595434 RepID=A0A0J1B5Z3_RHOIS|nr:hypothetical protein RISK_005301 [Rhodopirellula islandica]
MGLRASTWYARKNARVHVFPDLGYDASQQILRFSAPMFVSLKIEVL